MKISLKKLVIAGFILTMGMPVLYVENAAACSVSAYCGTSLMWCQTFGRCTYEEFCCAADQEGVYCSCDGAFYRILCKNGRINRVPGPTGPQG